jgi:hypothetical protein
MEKIVANELTKTLIILGIVVTSISILLFRMISKVRGGFNAYMKATLVYLLLMFIAFSFVACLVYLAPLRDLLVFYIIFQCCFLLLGIGHVNWMREFLKWSGDSKAVWMELIFTVVTGLTGSIGFIIVYRLFNTGGLEYDMATCIISFIIPWFVDQTFRRSISIPPKIFKQWFYPVEEEVEEPDERKLKNLLLISFEFQKNFIEQHYTNFRAKAPVDMKMSEVFFFFLNDYNERHPNDKIQFINERGESFGWIFYKKPKWYTLITRFVDPDKTVFINCIKENDVIICSRSLN